MAEFITTGELARRLGKSTRTIYRWLEQGILEEPRRAGAIRLFDWDRIRASPRRRNGRRRALLLEVHAEVKRGVEAARLRLGGRPLPDIVAIIREGRR